MAATIKLTSKRQATFPAEVCNELGIGPGDEIELQPRIEGGEHLWVLRKAGAPSRPWLRALKKYGSGSGRRIDHSMESVRDSIHSGRSNAIKKKRN